MEEKEEAQILDDENNTDSYQHQDDPNKLVLNNLNYETLFVDTTTDLKSIFESNFQEIPGNEKQSLGEFIRLFNVLLITTQN